MVTSCFFFFSFFVFILLLFSHFSYSCANTSCACGQTGNHSDSGLIDNQNVIKYRRPQPPNNVRTKNDTVATFNENKSNMTRNKTTGAIVATEPIYVNRLQNQTVNYNINNNINENENENDYYNSVENDDITKAESIIYASKTKKNHKLIGKPPSGGEKYLRSFFGLSLDEREMPITRERSKLLQANNNTKRSVGDVKKIPKLGGSPKLLRASTCDAYPSRGRNR